MADRSVDSRRYPGSDEVRPTAASTKLRYVPNRSNGKKCVFATQILAYLEAFADAFDLRRLLRLGVRVAHVLQLRDDPPPSGSETHGAASGDAGRAGSGAESHSCAANPQTQSGAGGRRWRVLIAAADAQDSAPGQVTGQHHRCR